VWAVTIAGALAQQGPTDSLKLEGYVKELGTGQAVPYATVSLRTGNAGSGSTPAKTIADKNGKFTFEVPGPGGYAVSAEADGYRVYLPYDLPVRVAAGTGARGVEVILYRPGVITGRLAGVAPSRLAKLKVQAIEVLYLKGNVVYGPVGVAPVAPDPDGTFRISSLRPAEYVVEITSETQEQIVPSKLPEYTETKPRPWGFSRRFWPEGFEGYAPSVRLLSGSEMSFWNVDVEARPLYRIHGTLATSGCLPGESVKLALVQHYGVATMNRAVRKLPCESEFTVTNLSPGRYHLGAWIDGRAPAERTYADADVVIQESDPQIVLAPVPPLRIAGKVKFPEGFPASLKPKLGVSQWSHLNTTFPDANRPIRTDSSGAFVLSLPNSTPVKLSLSGLQAPYYVKHILYNGSHIAGPMLRPNPGALTQDLEIVLSDRAGTVSGSVSERGRSVPGASVMLVAWPPKLEQGFPVVEYTRADDAGRFAKAGLAPATYRVLSLASSIPREMFHKPGVLVEWASRAAEVQLQEGATAVVNVEVTER
jgi:hypothetical protein